MKLLILGLSVLLATGSAFASEAEGSKVIHDKTGFFVHLDVAKVLSDTQTLDKCGVVPARFDYLNHQGEEHVLDYLVMGTGCNDGN
ncbi:DUF2790 domain-containing protein [Pseudomonas antarctica]|uniref:DUF2790 domain-containing protein n=1 Tax=Pseudomonas antarctica TaxID=219572 RepID=UPI003F74E0B1